MRKLFLGLIICTLFISCFAGYIVHRIFIRGERNISVRVKETEDSYQFYASYNRFRTRQVQNYIDREMNTGRVFRNARIDADMTLDKDIFVHVKSRPGLLVIKMDKTRNDSAAYHRIKELGEGIKEKLTEGGSY